MPTNYDRLFNQAQGQELINALHGIKSSLDANYPLEDINVELTNEPQTILPSEGYYGINCVNVPRGGSGEGYVTVPNNSTLIGSFNFPVEIAQGTTRAASMFRGLPSFNQPLNIPNSVTNMEYMFANCYNFNQPVNIPDSVLFGNYSFNYCTNLNSLIKLSNNLQYANYMFSSCYNFNQPINIPNSLIEAGDMFSSCSNFNQPVTIPNNVTNCARMFLGCGKFNYPITIPNSVANCYQMFDYCSNFNQPVDIPDSVTYCAYMVSRCINFNSTVNFSKNNTIGVNMWYMFTNCWNYNLPVDFNGVRATCDYMFTNCINFNQPVVIPNTIVSMGAMFAYCRNLKSNVYIDCLGVTTQRPCNYMFQYCNELSDIHVINLKNNMTFYWALSQNYNFRRNIYTDDNGINILVNTALIVAASAATYLDDPDNGCKYNTKYNLYIYNNWDGTIPDVL